jgi:ATP-binding cassette, subfamily B, bacterial MsbA
MIILWGCLCMIVTAISTAVLATYLKPIFDDIFIGHKKELLYWISAGVLSVFSIKGISEYGGNLCMEYVGQKMMLNIQKHLFEHLLHLNLHFFKKNHGAELMSLMTNDVRLVRNSILQALTGILKESVTVISLVSVMFFENWFLSCIALIGFPLAILPLVYCGRKVRKLTHSLQEDVSSFQVFFQQIFQGIVLIKTSQTENQEIQNLKERLDRFFKKSLRAFSTKALIHPVMEIFAGFAIVFVIINGGMQVMTGDQTTGSFLTFITSLLFVYRPAKNILNLNNILQEGLAATERVFHLLRQPKQKIYACISKGDDFSAHKKDICFQDVTFQYPEQQSPILKSFSCCFKGGQKSALVGYSGAGKTTLFYLLLQFYHLSKGMIKIGEQNIQDLDPKILRQEIAFVSQETMLFDDTIYHNIAYGCPWATKEDVYEASALAYADEFILQLPEKFQTRIGENGTRLSGGQRQRLAIARAFLKKASILLLDEATSALDNASEAKIQKALERLTYQKTTIMIAHRLSTIESADCIFVLKNGSIDDFGKHADLLQKGGLYRELTLLSSSPPLFP